MGAAARIPYAKPRKASTSAHIDAVQPEFEWVKSVATEQELQRYISMLRDEILTLGQLTPAQLATIESELTELADPRPTELQRLRSLTSWLYEVLSDEYVAASGRPGHWSDCRVNCAPAFKPGPCNCNYPLDDEAQRH